MSDIKLLLTDLDGTLLRKDHLTITDRTKDALRALKRNGVKLCACTGRVLALLPKALDDLDFDYAITSNGASCIDLKTREHIFTAHIPADRAEYAWNLMQPLDPIVEWFVNDDLLLDYHNRDAWPDRLKAVWHRQHLGAGKGRFVEDIRTFFRDGAPGLEKISTFDCPPEMQEKVVEPLLATGHFEISTSLGINFEITDIAADKGRALNSLCAHMGIDASSTLAFGDAGNDTPLLAAAGMSVAMGNAIPSLKELATAVTLSNEEDGVAVYLEQSGLI